MSKFINPSKRQIERLELSDGEWVDIKKRLTNREHRAIDAAGLKWLSDKGKEELTQHVDVTEFDIVKVETYLVGWSFVDDDRNSVQLNRENLELLEEDTFAEIVSALDKWTESKNSLTPKAGGVSQNMKVASAS